LDKDAQRMNLQCESTVDQQPDEPYEGGRADQAELGALSTFTNSWNQGNRQQTLSHLGTGAVNATP
jgi:hypothetical protein